MTIAASPPSDASHAGTIKAGQKLARLTVDGKNLPETARYLYTFQGLKKVEVDEVAAGDIVPLPGWKALASARRWLTRLTPSLCRPSKWRSQPSA